MLRLLMTPAVLFPTRDFERERKSVCARVCECMDSAKER